MGRHRRGNMGDRAALIWRLSGVGCVCRGCKRGHGGEAGHVQSQRKRDAVAKTRGHVVSRSHITNSESNQTTQTPSPTQSQHKSFVFYEQFVASPRKQI
jgi:hypothetical protein